MYGLDIARVTFNVIGNNLSSRSVPQLRFASDAIFDDLVFDLVRDDPQRMLRQVGPFDVMLVCMTPGTVPAMASVVLSNKGTNTIPVIYHPTDVRIIYKPVTPVEPVPEPGPDVPIEPLDPPTEPIETDTP
jgi:hypothetical protein